MVLSRMAGESHHLLYRFLHETAKKIARSDSFYVAFYGEDHVMVFPYSYDNQEFADPARTTYNDDRLAAWMLQHQLPYWSKQDDSALLRKGESFGDHTRESAESIAVPIFALNSKKSGDQLLGILSIQSYEPDSYNEDSIRALEWLANSIAIVFAREREDETRRRELGDAEETETRLFLEPENILFEALEKIASIRHKGEAVRQLIPLSETAWRAAVEELCRECEQRQTEMMELFLRSPLNQNNPLVKLSAQERNIVLLLVEGFSLSRQGYTNRQIANKLFIVEDTVKTHLKAIYKKLGISGRTGVVKIVSPYLLHQKKP